MLGVLGVLGVLGAGRREESKGAKEMDASTGCGGSCNDGDGNDDGGGGGVKDCCSQAGEGCNFSLGTAMVSLAIGDAAVYSTLREYGDWTLSGDDRRAVAAPERNDAWERGLLTPQSPGDLGEKRLGGGSAMRMSFSIPSEKLSLDDAFSSCST